MGVHRLWAAGWEVLMSVVAQAARPDAAVYDPDVEHLPLPARFFMYLNNKCKKSTKKTWADYKRCTALSDFKTRRKINKRHQECLTNSAGVTSERVSLWAATRVWGDTDGEVGPIVFTADDIIPDQWRNTRDEELRGEHAARACWWRRKRKRRKRRGDVEATSQLKKGSNSWHINI